MVRSLFCLSLFYLSFSTTTATADDSTAMLKLANALSPTPRGWSKDGTANYCDWYGVLCDGSYRVVAIKLANRKLYGTLPMELSTLLQLKSFSLQNNHLSGAIPSLANLSSLQKLNLGGNNFSSIPQGFFKGLIKLQVLIINRNSNLAPWSIPTDLAESSSLKAFLASHANIGGAIPDIFASLPSLVSLRLSYNNLTGILPASLANSRIKSLWLNNQQMGLSGTLDVLSSMTQLSQAWLLKNQFTGSIPDLSNCESLFDLQLRDNRLTGIIPSSLISHRGLRKISLTNNKLQGPVPEFPSNIFVSIENDNNFCLSNPGVPCDPQVNIMLEVASALGYPEILANSWRGNDACENWAFVTCDNHKNITTINFGKQNFSGTVSSSLANLTSLRKLFLSGTNLTGFIPDSLTSLTYLEVLDISNNNLSGKIPVFASSVKLITTPGNPSLEIGNGSRSLEIGNGSRNDGPVGTGNRGNHQVSPSMIAGVVVPVITCIALVLLMLFKYNFKNRHGKSSKVNDEENGNALGRKHSYPHFELSIELIREATDNFNENNILGKGGFGVVYKGKLKDGRTSIAVKRVKATSMAGSRGMNEFEAEMSVLTKAKHRHLVYFMGYCVHDDEGFLVYEYMPQGTLAQHLFHWRERSSPPLTWTQRVSIALDVARGVEYLHNLAEESSSFIHRDLKPSNILLGDDMRAKVSDFGLVKYAPVSKSSFPTRVAGTFGYLAPEYAETGRVTKKVDVYALGAILMEMITGRKAIDNKMKEEGWMNVHLVTWFHGVLKGKDISEAIDQTLNPDEETFKSICKIAEFAAHCTARNPHRRPDICHVVNILASLVEKWNPPAASTIDPSFVNKGHKHVTF